MEINVAEDLKLPGLFHPTVKYTAATAEGLTQVAAAVVVRRVLALRPRGLSARVNVHENEETAKCVPALVSGVFVFVPEPFGERN